VGLAPLLQGGSGHTAVPGCLDKIQKILTEASTQQLGAAAPRPRCAFARCWAVSPFTEVTTLLGRLWRRVFSTDNPHLIHWETAGTAKGREVMKMRIPY